MDALVFQIVVHAKFSICEDYSALRSIDKRFIKMGLFNIEVLWQEQKGMITTAHGLIVGTP